MSVFSAVVLTVACLLPDSPTVPVPAQESVPIPPGATVIRFEGNEPDKPTFIEEIVPIGGLEDSLRNPLPRTLLLAPGVHAGRFEVRYSGLTLKPLEGDWTATIDGWLNVLPEAERTTLEGLEIRSSLSETQRVQTGLFVSGPESRVVRCYVHDCGAFGVWTPATDTILDGCIATDVGYRDGSGTGRGYALYCQSGTTLTIKGGIYGRSLANWSIHGYTEQGLLNGITIDGARILPSGRESLRFIQIGGLQPVRNARVANVEVELLYFGFGRSVRGQSATIAETVNLSPRYRNAIQVKGFWDRLDGLTRYPRSQVLIYDDTTLWDRMWAIEHPDP